MDRVALFATGAFLVIVFVGQTLMALVMKVPLKTEAKETSHSFVYRLIGAAPLALYMISGGHHLTAHWMPDIIRQEGLVVIVLGIALIFWSQLTLGRNWVGGIGLHPKHQLVTSGPYVYVRHPLYSGFCLAAIGVTVASANLAATAGAVTVAYSLLVRIPEEEQLMRKQFGRAYQEYAKRTGWLLPHIRHRT